MSREVAVSILIPCYDGDASGVLKELARQSLKGWEHVVIPNVSPASLARNRAAGQARGEVLIFIDDDVIFSGPQVLSEVVRVLLSGDRKDAVNITWRLAPRANWVQRKQAADPLFTFDRQGTVAEISWRECGAACFAIRSSLFASLGGYDENLISGEDCDLAYRLTKDGGRIITLPHCWIEHHPPRSIGKAVQKTFWYERGNAQVARKHPEADYRINLDRPWKAVAYLFLRTAALLPLMFFKVNYRQRRPQLAFRPFETLLSYLGAWAYAGEWLCPSRQRARRDMDAGCVPEVKKDMGLR